MVVRNTQRERKKEDLGDRERYGRETGDWLESVETTSEEMRPHINKMENTTEDEYRTSNMSGPMIALEKKKRRKL